MKLKRHFVDKPWGRPALPPIFDAPEGRRIGEVWFDAAENQPLLVKYIFTSEKLSIQVHPDDAQARARGLARGKSECWYILDADQGSTLGLGLKQSVSSDELRRSALDGSIEQLMDWRPVGRGDFFRIPPGTVHAIGAGITLLEVQQNADVTYRLYDYGRPRELHLDDGIDVARGEPYPPSLSRHVSHDDLTTLVDSDQFILLQSDRDQLTARDRHVIPLAGTAREGECIARPGDCLLVGAGEQVEVEGRVLIAAASA